MFLSFDEGCDDLINGCDSCSLFNLLKSVLNDFDIAQVLVHKSFFLTIRGHDFGETQLEDGQGVLEFTRFRLFFSWCSRLVVVDLVFLFFLVEFVLIAFDLGLKVVFIFLVLGSQGNRLVDLLLSQLHRVHSLSVFLLSLLMHFLGKLGKSFGFIVLVHDLSAKHIDFSLVLVVLGLGLVETELLLLDGVVLAVQANLVQLVVHGFRSDLLDVLLFLAEFILDLFDLILDDLQLAFFILELLGVDVDFALQSSGFTLVNWVVPTAHRATCN